MRMLVDLVAATLLLLASPWWITRMARRGTLRTDWAGRLGVGPRLPAADRPRVLIHAVSVGEVAASMPLVDAMTGGEEPGDVVLSVTTDTGVARARQLAGDRLPVVRTPLAFHTAVGRWLDRCRPDVLVLMELEVWPSMVAAARRRGIPVLVVNGRLTARSLRRYLRVRRLVAGSFAQLAACAVQDEATAERFRAVGVPADRIAVTGTMKWDRAEIADDADGAEELAVSLGIDRDRPLVVAGSTSPEEVRLIDEAVGDRAQVLVAPRRPEWFDAAAADMPGATRRSVVRAGDAAATRGGGPRGRFVLDTIGELRAAYALADVVIVGRSFGTLHGSDMMEPVGLGKPVIVGPRTGDFQVVTDDLLAGGGLLQVEAAELPATVARLLEDPAARRDLAERGREVIRRRRGAAARNAAIIRSSVPARGVS